MSQSKIKTSNNITYVFDLDGVVYRGKELQPYARETLTNLTKLGHNIFYFTNNAAKSRDTYVQKLNSLNIEANINQIMTSAYATALYFIENGHSGKKVYQIGEAGLKKELEEVGMQVFTDAIDNIDDIDFVVIGLDRKFNYEKMKYAHLAIMNGAKFIATNRDTTFPIENGVTVPGGGCMVAAVETSTNVKPLVIGKPEIYAYNKILEITNTKPENSIMVGDRLDTDILVGNRAGAQTVLVLTGITSKDEALKAKGDSIPDRIIDNLGELIQ
ncbi:MAG: phosphoglycolate/pyridoxal phosphate family phosphatase [Armatimonadota bacterium]